MGVPSYKGSAAEDSRVLQKSARALDLRAATGCSLPSAPARRELFDRSPPPEQQINNYPAIRPGAARTSSRFALHSRVLPLCPCLCRGALRAVCSCFGWSGVGGLLEGNTRTCGADVVFKS